MSSGLLGDLPPVQVTPSQPMPGAVSAPAPHAAQLPPQAPPMGRMQRLHERLLNYLSPTPQGYEGLLSRSEIKAARPGLLQSLIGTPDAPSTRERYQQNLDSIIGHRQLGQQMKEHEFELTKQHQLEAQRAHVQAQLGPPPNDPAAFDGWARKAYGEFLRIGDLDSIQKLNAVMQQIMARQSAKPADDTEWQDFGGYKALVKKSTGEEIRRQAKSPSPRDPNAPDTAALARDQKMFDRTNRLSDDFFSQSKEIMKAADGFRTVMQVAPAARQGHPQAQMAMIFGFMHSLDPSSTVREGEYANAQNTAGVPDKVRNAYNKMLQGQFLTPAQIDGFVETARQSAQGWQTRQSNLHRLYSQRAGRWKIDPRDVVVDYFEGIDMGGSGSKSTPSKPATGADNVRSLLRKP